MIHYAEAHVRMVKPEETPADPVSPVRIQQCKHGRFCYFPHDLYIGGALERYGEYVEAELDLLLSYLKPGDVVVEAGGNIGCDTVPLAKRVTNAGRVFSFEPQRIIHQMLCGNLAMNAIWNVVAERCALGAAHGVAFVPPVDYSKEGNFGGVPLEKSGGEPAQVIALDALGLARCDLLKIDVEGMELAVLQGAADTIKRLRPVIYCENDRDEKGEALIKHLHSLDYDLYWHCPPMFNADNYRGNPVNDYMREGLNIVSINMLGLPKERGETCTLAPVVAPLQTRGAAKVLPVAATLDADGVLA